LAQDVNNLHSLKFMHVTFVQSVVRHILPK
jgi:hypothetical protein